MARKRAITLSSSSEGILMDIAFEEFMVEKELSNLSHHTLYNYRASYKYFKEFLSEEYPEVETMEMLTKKLIQDWTVYLRRKGTSPNGINAYLTNIRAFSYWAMKEEQGYTTPFSITMLKSAEPQLVLYTEEEQSKLIERPRKIKGNFVEWRMWATVNLILATGARSATVRDIRKGDIDFLNNYVWFRHTKNKKNLQVPLSSALGLVLKEYIRLWRKDASSEAYLFPAITDTKLTSTGLREAFERYCKNREVEHYNIHGLRHAFAKGYIMNDGNPMILQGVLGHSTMAMTQRYVKLFGEDLKENYDSFSPLDTLKKKNTRTHKIKR